MDCAQTEWLVIKRICSSFRKKVAEQRMPLFGSIDLTHRCNLRCIHCYLGDKEVINKSVKKNSAQRNGFPSLTKLLKPAACIS